MPEINTSCPECPGMLEFVDAWVENHDFVVIVGECPECGYKRPVHIVGFDHTEYWEEGYAAFLTEDTNPYNKFDPRWMAWEIGWAAAERMETDVK